MKDKRGKQMSPRVCEARFVTDEPADLRDALRYFVFAFAIPSLALLLSVILYPKNLFCFCLWFFSVNFSFYHLTHLLRTTVSTTYWHLYPLITAKIHVNALWSYSQWSDNNLWSAVTLFYALSKKSWAGSLPRCQCPLGCKRGILSSILEWLPSSI